jgi:regulator of PEP synthase PpsR (kinase-PPPase family)
MIDRAKCNVKGFTLYTDRANCAVEVQSCELAPYKFSDRATCNAKDCANFAIEDCATAMGSKVNG